MTLAQQLREAAIHVPPDQTIRLLALAADAARLEEALDHIVEEAAADALAFARLRRTGRE